MAAADPAPPPPTYDHVVIVIEENHALGAVMGSPEAPYLNSLAASGMSFTNFYAITHPSQPNYLQFFSGSNQGILDNTVPAPGAPFSTPNLGAELMAAGKSFAGYSEGLGFEGNTATQNGDYVRRHNPWVNWQTNSPSGNRLPSTVNKVFTTGLATDFTTLPKVSIVIPDLQHDMHDGTIGQGDTWLQDNLGAYATWAQTHNSLLVVTFDEDKSDERNRIPTVFSGANVKQGTNNATWTLHNLLRTVEDIYGTGHAGAAANVKSITGAFTTDVQSETKTFRDDANNYHGTQDTFIDGSTGNTAATHGGDAQVVVDGSPLNQGLIRFDGLTGAGAIPAGATILSAKLTLLTGNGANNEASLDTFGLYRMKRSWAEGDSWSSLSGGVSTDGIEAAATSEFSLLPNTASAYGIFDVTDTVQMWVNGQADNYGWMIRDDSGTDGWRFISSEALTNGNRPVLEITYAVPEPGSIGLLFVGAAAALMRGRHNCAASRV